MTDLARQLWGDTGWRTIIIALAPIFLLQTGMELGGNPGGTGLLWTAMLITLLLICRALTMRRLAGGPTDPENLFIFLSVGGIILIQVLYAFTSVGATFLDQAIFWPFTLVLYGILIASRLAAPYLTNPLNVWLLVLLFPYYWMLIATWKFNAVFPEPPFVWGVALIGFAVIARAIVGRGLGGPLMSPLNVMTGLFIVLTLWVEYAFEISGVGADPFGYQELYWPWFLVIAGVALACRAAAPKLAALCPLNK